MSNLVLDPLHHSILLQVELDSVSLLDIGMRESDCPAVVSDNVRDLVGSDQSGLDFQQFEPGFCFLDLEESEATLDVIEHPVVLVGLDDCHYVHHTDWELDVTSDFIINLDPCLLVLNDDVGFAAGQRQSQSVPVSIDPYLRMIESGRHSRSLWGP